MNGLARAMLVVLAVGATAAAQPFDHLASAGRPLGAAIPRQLAN